jgi:hypothetical protein
VVRIGLGSQQNQKKLFEKNLIIFLGAAAWPPSGAICKMQNPKSSSERDYGCLTD